MKLARLHVNIFDSQLGNLVKTVVICNSLVAATENRYCNFVANESLKRLECHMSHRLLSFSRLFKEALGRRFNLQPHWSCC